MKELTKQMLDNWKIKVEFDPSTETGYRVWHYGQIPGKAEFSWKEIKQSLNRRHHPKSGNTKRYYIVSFSDYANNKKEITIPLHRLVWAYFIGDIPAGYDISHKDDNSFNNYINLDYIEESNLECITHKENLNKRKCKWANQYGNGNKIMNVITAEISAKVDEAIYGDRIPKGCRVYDLPEEQNKLYGFSIDDSVFQIELEEEGLTIIFDCPANIGFEINEGKLYDFNSDEYFNSDVYYE